MTIHSKMTMIAVLKVFNIIGLILLIFLSLVVLNRIAQQSKQTHDDTVASTARIENDLNCLGRFFSQPDRRNLKINDLTTCQIINTSTGATSTLAGPPPGPSAAPSTNTSPTSQPTSDQPITTQQTPQTNSSEPPTTTSEPPDPQTTLGKVLSPVKKLLGGL